MDQDAGKICPVCNTVIMPNENVRRCPHCGVAYHADCWIKNGGCATPGCPANSAAPSVPPQQNAPQAAAPQPFAPPIGAPVSAEAPKPGPAPAAAPPSFAANAVPIGAQPPAAPPAKARNPIVAHILGILSGILSIVLGCVCFGMVTGSGYSYETYGGDAYTGIQQAAAQTAKNTAYMADIIRFGFAGLLIVVGVALIALFLGKIIGREKS